MLESPGASPTLSSVVPWLQEERLSHRSPALQCSSESPGLWAPEPARHLRSLSRELTGQARG